MLLLPPQEPDTKSDMANNESNLPQNESTSKLVGGPTPRKTFDNEKDNEKTTKTIDYLSSLETTDKFVEEKNMLTYKIKTFLLKDKLSSFGSDYYSKYITPVNREDKFKSISVHVLLAEIRLTIEHLVGNKEIFVFHLIPKKDMTKEEIFAEGYKQMMNKMKEYFA